MNKHNQKLADKGIPFVALDYPTGNNAKSRYKCPNGHEFSADRARMMRGVAACPSCPGNGQGRTRTHEGYLNDLFVREIDFIPVEQYQGANVKILHECINGHQTEKTPNSVLQGSGCAKCSGVAKLTTEEYVERLVKMGSDIRPVNEYAGMMTKLRHKCGFCDWEWEAKPHDIVNGTGCPACASFGLNRAKPATLYYVKLWDSVKTYYKVGVTNKSVQVRLRNCGKQFKVLLEKQYDTGREAEAAEKMILEEYQEALALAPRWLKTGGNTELFKWDVLLLDVD